MNITKSRTIVKGKHVALYSRAKNGKTSFIAEALIDAGENGLMVLVGEDGLSEHKIYRDKINVYGDENGDYRVFGENGKKEEWVNFLDALKEIYTEWAAPGKVLCIDSVDMIINGSATEYCINTYFEDKEKWSNEERRKVIKSKREQAIEFGGDQLIKHLAMEFDKFLTLIKFLQNKGVTIYTTWHSSVSKWKNPFEEMDYDKISVDLKANKNTSLRENLKNCCSMLLYADIKSSVNKRTNRVDGGNNAFLFTEGTATYDATKARGINLPEELPFEFKSFKKYIADEFKPKKEYNKPIDDVVETPKASQQFLTTMEQLKAQVGEEKYNDFMLSHKITNLEEVVDHAKQTLLYKGLKALTA